MSPSKSNPFDKTPEKPMTDNNVTRLDDHDVEVFGGSQNRRDSIAPKRFRIGDDPHVFTVYEPDAGTVMEIEEAGSSRRVLALFLGDEWGKAEAAIEGEQPDALVDLAQSLSRHFKLYSGAVEGNRAARRRSGRRG